jgi:DNA-binding CsgD family transcriptional regulator
VDLISDRALRRTPYYHLVLEPLGVTDRLAAALPSPPTHAKRFFFDRVGGTFSERDRDVLEALRPHLGRLWRAADTRRKLRAALAALGRSPEAEPQDADAAALTPRERQILGLVAQGKTNPEIAEILWIAPTTVRKHLEHVYAKLGVRTRTAAVTRFLAVDFPPARSSNR